MIAQQHLITLEISQEGHVLQNRSQTKGQNFQFLEVSLGPAGPGI